MVGILGGMGPMATVEAYRRIVLATPARRDQDHLHVIIDADPSVPDRTLAIIDGGPDPRPWLGASAARLVAAGAEIICMPCNTAHAFYPWLQDRVPVPIIHMVDEVAADATRVGARIVGLLSTQGTIATGIYSDTLTRAGLECRMPSDAAQSRVDEAIALVKAGDVGMRPAELFAEAAGGLTADGADVIVLGCTEISLLRDALARSFLVVDALQSMVDRTVRLALAEHTPSRL